MFKLEIVIRHNFQFLRSNFIHPQAVTLLEQKKENKTQARQDG